MIYDAYMQKQLLRSINMLKEMQEIFDAPAQTSAIRSDTARNHKLRFSIQTKSGIQQDYIVDFDLMYDMSELTGNPEHEKLGIWELSFAKITGLGKNKRADYQLIGRGEETAANRVFATIFKAVTDFVHMKKPPILFMTANLGESSRIRFYEAFSRKLAPQIGSELFSKIDFFGDDGKNAYYIFVNEEYLPLIENLPKEKT